MIRIVEDSILNSTTDVIAHQVNCQGSMGSGVAKELRAKHPKLFEDYSKYCAVHRSPEDLMGKVQIVEVKDSIIANLFGQLDYHRKGKPFVKHTSEKSLELALYRLSKYVKERGFTVAFPFGMGCARGGARWSDVDKLINTYFDPDDVLYYKYDAEDTYEIKL